MIEKLEKIGWFENFPLELQKDTVSVIQWSVNHGYDTLAPPVAYSLDYESIDRDEPYGTVIRGFSEASHGIFQPENINEQYNRIGEHGGEFVISFVNNGIPYSITIPHESDWLHPSFFVFLDRVMDDTGTGLRFIDLNSLKADGDQTGDFILANPQAFVQAAQNKLITYYEYKYDGERGKWIPRNPYEPLNP